MDKAKTKWLDWAIELQAIPQTGLEYSKDLYDIERFERIRDISAEIMTQYSELNFQIVKELFCNEKGFQTPKLDSRAAIFHEDKILLVKENNQKWSLPGGWVDVNESIKTNIIKEIKEESGYIATALKIIAVQDRNKHNSPIHAYGIIKVFVLWSVDNSPFVKNTETLERGFFSLYNLPELSIDKNTKDQIQMCFEASKEDIWQTIFD